VNGIWGGFTGVGAKTVLPAEAHAKVSMRLVSNQSSKDIEAKFEAFIRSIAPETVEVSMQAMHGGEPSISRRDSPYVAAASAALEQTFGKPTYFIREGGSIPVVGSFQKLLGLETLLVGFGLADDRIHSPNEKFDLENFHAASRFSVHFWDEMAKLGTERTEAPSLQRP
jgi:acetylornithine deacetylase/succinyl-diaminopimelate desuccinylase-like protein